MKSSLGQVLLLVDGYNIIGAWEQLKKTRDREGLESARRHLVSLLIDYTSYQGYRTEVIFDSHLQRTPMQREKCSPHLMVYYTAFAQTADTYIEKVCASFNRAETPLTSRLIVATSDRAQRLTAVGYGAEWFSANKFQSEVESSAARVKRKHHRQAKPRGRFLFNHLDPKTQAALFQLRRGSG